MLQMQLFAMQIGAKGAFGSDVCYKMPTNVCKIVKWLWRGEVFYNFQASFMEIITWVKRCQENYLLLFSSEIHFPLQQLIASLLNRSIHSFRNSFVHSIIHLVNNSLNI